MSEEIKYTQKHTTKLIVLSAIPLSGMTVLPDTIIHFDLKRQSDIRAVERAMMKDGRLFLITQRNAGVEEPDLAQLYRTGTIAVVKQVTRLSNQSIRVLVEGLKRGLLSGIRENEGQFLEVYVEEIEQQGILETKEGSSENSSEDSPEEAGLRQKLQQEAMLRQLREHFQVFAAHYPKLGRNALQRYADIDDLGSLMDQIAMNLPVSYEKKQQILDAVSLKERYRILSMLLVSEVEIARIRENIAQKVKGRVDQNQKEYLLREQLKYIREELGEENSLSDADQFEEAVDQLQASQEVKDRIRKEIRRFRNLSGSSSESAVERAYIETLLELPWDKVSVDNQSIKRAEKILERDHYGLEKVKERILEFLAVRRLTAKGDSPIICLVGPPGTGKTSIAKSVAEALDKKYIRICLGGVRDEAEIRGHRRTYVGAMPGRLAAGLRQAGVKNPLILLDEIDKVSSDHKGDTFSALLEVLDGEQNVRFRDHYVELPLDLSEVLFVATANTTQTIPSPLLDRMEIIEVNSYTANEKFHIAKEHLLKKQLEKNGLTRKMLSIQDGAIRSIITHYTKEAGVRSLERRIGDICRKAAREILRRQENQEEASLIKVTASNLEKYLGKKKYTSDKAKPGAQIGIVRGLAWTSVGGDTLQIEVNVMPGKGEIDLTGQMGDVMKESAIIGMSYVRSIGGDNHIPTEIFKESDFHIHIPEGAVPKDGPSAGITMATALFSALTGKPVRSDLAMTGEITLRGRVLPVGGLKEKLLAAKTAGLKEVLVPAENKKDIEEISQEIKDGLMITYVKDMEEVIRRALAERQGG